MQQGESALSVGLIIVLVILLVCQLSIIAFSVSGFYLVKEAPTADGTKDERQNNLHYVTMATSTLSIVLVGIIGFMTRKKLCYQSPIHTYVSNELNEQMDEDGGFSVNDDRDRIHHQRTSSFYPVKTKDHGFNFETKL